MLVDAQIFYRNFYETHLDGQDFGKAGHLEEIVPIIASGMKEFYPIL